MYLLWTTFVRVGVIRKNKHLSSSSLVNIDEDKVGYIFNQHKSTGKTNVFRGNPTFSD